MSRSKVSHVPTGRACCKPVNKSGFDAPLLVQSMHIGLVRISLGHFNLNRFFVVTVNRI